MTSSVDVSDLLRTIETLQKGIQCPSCFLYYTKKWCTNNETSCFFCINFVSTRDTYISIMENIDWYYINSDEYDYALFCKEFKYNLKEWFSSFPEPKFSICSWLFL